MHILLGCLFVFFGLYANSEIFSPIARLELHPDKPLYVNDMGRTSIESGIDGICASKAMRVGSDALSFIGNSAAGHFPDAAIGDQRKIQRRAIELGIDISNISCKRFPRTDRELFVGLQEDQKIKRALREFFLKLLRVVLLLLRILILYSISMHLIIIQTKSVVSW